MGVAIGAAENKSQAPYGNQGDYVETAESGEGLSSGVHPFIDS